MQAEHIVAMVPARAGSEGLRHKNIKLLNGVPLLGYSLKPALACPQISATYLNSDSQEYLDIGAELGARTYQRPQELGQAQTSMKEVVADFVQSLKADGVPVDTVVVLYPTYPFRTVDHLQSMIDHFRAQPDCDSIIGLKDPAIHPYLCATLEPDKSIKTFIDYDVNRYYRRQEYPECYQITAWAMVVNANSLDVLNAQMMSEKTVGYQVPKDVKVIDIDTEMEFLFAEYLLQQGRI